jgi:hypothetical protein
MDASYYATNPEPARPPEGRLRAGTKVRLLGQRNGYARVETEDGIRGCVASNVLVCDATLKSSGVSNLAIPRRKSHHADPALREAEEKAIGTKSDVIFEAW